MTRLDRTGLTRRALLARLLALHDQRLGRLGDEDVLPAGQDFVKDGQVLGVDRQLGLLVA